MMPTTLITPRVPKKHKFRFKDGRDLVIAFRSLEKRPRRWGANVVCLANLASHITTCNLIRQGIIYPPEGHWLRNCDMKVRQWSPSVKAKTFLPEQTSAMILSKDWVNCDLKSNYGSTTLQVNVSSQITIRSQTVPSTEVTAEGITKNAKGNDDRKTIIAKKLKSHLEGLL